MPPRAFCSTVLLLLVALATTTTAFLLPTTPLALPSHSAAMQRRSASLRMEASSSGNTRRGLLQDLGRLGLAVGGLGLLNPTSFALPSNAASTEGPIAVLGARGKTGKLIIQGLLKQGKAVRALSYQPLTLDVAKDLGGVDAAGLLTYGIGDVTKPASLPEAVRGASAVIFASSASKKGGNAKAVDCDGVENVANACIDEKIPRLLVISSGAVSRPNSFGYKVTNLFGGIMGLKFLGEEKLRALYASSAPKGVTYTILRPGGLSNDAGLGPSGIELNQGDTVIGEVSRVDVAAAAVASLDAPDAANVTFEVYEIRRRAPLQKEFPATSGYERRGKEWPELFKGLVKDGEVKTVVG